MREQLQRGVRNSDALAEQLRSKLDLTHSEGGRDEEDGGGSRSSGSQVDGGEGETALGRRGPPPQADQHLTSATARPGLTAGVSSSVAGAVAPSPQLTSRPPETRILLGGLGTLTVRADVKMTTDGSTASLPQLSLSSQTPRRNDPSLLLSAPRGHSSPFVKGVGLQSSSHAPSASQRDSRTGGEGLKTRETMTHSQGHPQTADDARRSLTDYLSREGIPKLEPAIPPSYPPPTAERGAPRVSSSAGKAPSASPSTERRRKREFESFESRLQQALDSSSLQVNPTSGPDLREMGPNWPVI